MKNINRWLLQSRVDGSTFTFTAEEFKNYYNDYTELFGSKIKDFTEIKGENRDYYSSINYESPWVI